MKRIYVSLVEQLIDHIGYLVTEVYQYFSIKPKSISFQFPLNPVVLYSKGNSSDFRTTKLKGQ